MRSAETYRDAGSEPFSLSHRCRRARCQRRQAQVEQTISSPKGASTPFCACIGTFRRTRASAEYVGPTPSLAVGPDEAISGVAKISGLFCGRNETSLLSLTLRLRVNSGTEQLRAARGAEEGLFRNGQ